MVCNGAIVRGRVERSVLSPGVYVSPGALVRDMVMNDVRTPRRRARPRDRRQQNVVVGRRRAPGLRRRPDHAE
ncbi:MAG: hypothetical protein U0Z44_11835 [Kouleothrix sp.]